MRWKRERKWYIINVEGTAEARRRTMLRRGVAWFASSQESSESHKHGNQIVAMTLHLKPRLGVKRVCQTVLYKYYDNKFENNLLITLFSCIMFFVNIF